MVEPSGRVLGCLFVSLTGVLTGVTEWLQKLQVHACHIVTAFPDAPPHAPISTPFGVLFFSAGNVPTPEPSLCRKSPPAKPPCPFDVSAAARLRMLGCSARMVEGWRSLVGGRQLRALSKRLINSKIAGNHVPGAHAGRGPRGWPRPVAWLCHSGRVRRRRRTCSGSSPPRKRSGSGHCFSPPLPLPHAHRV